MPINIESSYKMRNQKSKLLTVKFKLYFLPKDIELWKKNTNEKIAQKAI